MCGLCHMCLCLIHDDDDDDGDWEGEGEGEGGIVSAIRHDCRKKKKGGGGENAPSTGLKSWTCEPRKKYHFFGGGSLDHVLFNCTAVRRRNVIFFYIKKNWQDRNVLFFVTHTVLPY